MATITTLEIKTADRLLVGTAGWSIPASERPKFAEGASVLERYSSKFCAVEINSSFYRAHQPATYTRWAGATPPAFRFSVKIPKRISHEAKLQDCDAALEEFLFESSHLGAKLGCLLLQLPPSLAFDASMERFFEMMRRRFTGPFAFEPRHRSWLETPALNLLKSADLWLVEADPSPIDLGRLQDQPPHYLRLHGSPRIYYSAYSESDLSRYTARLDQATDECWCIFDNTALGAATSNALELMAKLREGRATQMN